MNNCILKLLVAFETGTRKSKVTERKDERGDRSQKKKRRFRYVDEYLKNTGHGVLMVAARIKEEDCLLIK